ncbi:MAG: hypothetical protein ICV64_03720 [Thermoleophilia bacterium]|nr:hypothetical protein [Thermoleophilia bacterium]
MADEELTPDQLADHVRRLKVSDLLLTTCSTLAQLGYAKLAPDARDLEQAQLAIDSLRALVPVLERGAGEELARDFRVVVSNLQLAYAEAAGAAAQTAESGEETS